MKKFIGVFKICALLAVLAGSLWLYRPAASFASGQENDLGMSSSAKVVFNLTIKPEKVLGSLPRGACPKLPSLYATFDMLQDGNNLSGLATFRDDFGQSYYYTGQISGTLIDNQFTLNLAYANGALEKCTGQISAGSALSGRCDWPKQVNNNFCMHFGPFSGTAKGIGTPPSPTFKVSHSFTTTRTRTVTPRPSLTPTRATSTPSVTATKTFTPTPQEITITGNVQVKDPAYSAVLKNIPVELIDPQGKGIKTAYTDGNGRYSITQKLHPGEYSLRAYLQDRSGRRRILIGNNMAPVSTARSITVSGALINIAADIDFKSASNGQPDRLVKSAWAYVQSQRAGDFIIDALGYSAYTAPEFIQLWQGSSGWGAVCPKPYNFILVADDLSNNLLNTHPMVLWHEEFHALSAELIPALFAGGSDYGCNHGGATNPSTCDSLVEGWAEFWPTLMSGQSQWYFTTGASFNLDKDYKSSDAGGNSNNPNCANGIFQYEEFAVAGLLWDLQDGKTNFILFEKDRIEMDYRQLFSLMTAPEAPTIRTVRDLYFLLKNRIEDKNPNNNLYNKDNTRISTADLDQLWLNHGFLNNDPKRDGPYQPAEEPGWSANGQPASPAMMPDAYLILKTLPDGSTPDNIQIDIQIRDSIELYNVAYTQKVSAWPSKIYLIPPPADQVAVIDMTVTQNGKVLATYSLDNQKYWQWIRTSPKEEDRMITLKTGTKDSAMTGLKILSNTPIAHADLAFFGAMVQSGGQVTYQWDFGDHTTATGQLVNHIYTAPGNYTVRVTAQNSLGQVTQTQNIAVVRNQDPSLSPADNFWSSNNLIGLLIAICVLSFCALIVVLVIWRRQRPV